MGNISSRPCAVPIYIVCCILILFFVAVIIVGGIYFSDCKWMIVTGALSLLLTILSVAFYTFYNSVNKKWHKLVYVIITITAATAVGFLIASAIEKDCGKNVVFVFSRILWAIAGIGVVFMIGGGIYKLGRRSGH